MVALQEPLVKNSLLQLYAIDNPTQPQLASSEQRDLAPRWASGCVCPWGNGQPYRRRGQRVTMPNISGSHQVVGPTE